MMLQPSSGTLVELILTSGTIVSEHVNTTKVTGLTASLSKEFSAMNAMLKSIANMMPSSGIATCGREGASRTRKTAWSIKLCSMWIGAYPKQDTQLPMWHIKNLRIHNIVELTLLEIGAKGGIKNLILALSLSGCRRPVWLLCTPSQWSQLQLPHPS